MAIARCHQVPQSHIEDKNDLMNQGRKIEPGKDGGTVIFAKTFNSGQVGLFIKTATSQRV